MRGICARIISCVAEKYMNVWVSSGRNEEFERATCNGRIVSSRTITIELTEPSRDEVWWLSVTVCKGNWEEGVALPAVLHCPRPPQPVCLLPPSFTSGSCSLARLPVPPHAVLCYRYWFKWPDRVSSLYTDPPTDWFSDRSTKDWRWCNGGLEVVLMGTIYFHCKHQSLTGQVPPLPLLLLPCPPHMQVLV